ncbi:MAG: C4-dicarboxylate ABC transporter permease, partial [Pseudomonadota bacterium]
ASPMRTGFAAARFGAIAYIVPFLFIFFPGLLFKGTAGSIILAVATAFFGCYVLSAALSGYLFNGLGAVKRIILALAGIGLMIPIRSHMDVFTLSTNIAGGGLALLLVMKDWYGRSKS